MKKILPTLLAVALSTTVFAQTNDMIGKQNVGSKKLYKRWLGLSAQ